MRVYGARLICLRCAFRRKTRTKVSARFWRSANRRLRGNKNKFRVQSFEFRVYDKSQTNSLRYGNTVSKFPIRNFKLRTQNSELRTQNSELRTQNSELETRNS